MIQVSDITKKIKSYLEEKGCSFRIFIRINFQIDVYILSSNADDSENYYAGFISLLKNEEDSYYQNNAEELKVKFIIVSEEDQEYDPFYEKIFSENTPTINWGPRYRFNSLLEDNTLSEKDKRKTPVVTFYSYKGGMGRTTTMVAYAVSLAANAKIEERKRVVIIDCDLEAPGYLNFFNLSKHNGLTSGKKNGLVEFFSDSYLTKSPENLQIADYVIDFSEDSNSDEFLKEKLSNLFIVPAGNLNGEYADVEDDKDRIDYLQGLAKINLSNVTEILDRFNLLISKIETRYNPDIILIDSRTGFNDIFGAAALRLATRVVGFFGFSRQTTPGLMNLVHEYYKTESNFQMDLVFSILPLNAEERNEHHAQDILHFIERNYDTEQKDALSPFYLHRDPLLEEIGIGDESSDKKFIEKVVNEEIKDYVRLFDSINDAIFPKIESHAGLVDQNLDSVDNEFNNKSRKSAIQLRNVVLRNLKTALENIQNFAEDSDIEENSFFYRECMLDLFDSRKFLIQGYKGTGKTYLYKALENAEISKNIQKWRKEKKGDKEEIGDCIFVQVLPPEQKTTIFSVMSYDSVSEPDHYFKSLWQIYTWNVLLSNPEFSEIREKSQNKEKVITEIDGGEAEEALLKMNELVGKGLEFLVEIKKDLKAINDHLNNSGKKLFILYDRLDSIINPLKWTMAVSPLINYWWENCETYSNICPKVFIRTDLFAMIQGTNTGRLAERIVHIEWSMGEVFGYFTKLVFSHKPSANAIWEIAEKLHVSAETIDSIKKQFDTFPYNQFTSLNKSNLFWIVRIIFGTKVRVNGANLGTPWEYFERELSNADNSAISLRPFINTLNKNAVNKTLEMKGSDRHVQNILPPEIYASKEVREKTTEQYFEDLTQDTFSKDLFIFRDVVRKNESFKYKALDENAFKILISTTMEAISKSDVVHCSTDLERLIFANGIMARIPTRKGIYYNFAPIYWYSWGLKNSGVEKESVGKAPQLEPGKRYQNTISYDHVRKSLCIKVGNLILPIRDAEGLTFTVGDRVLFTAQKDGAYFYATNVGKVD